VGLPVSGVNAAGDSVSVIALADADEEELLLIVALMAKVGSTWKNITDTFGT